MHTSIHTLNSLFDQLGLPSTSDEIDKFIEQHKPVADHKAIYEMDFFDGSQKAFLKEATERDAKWADLTDTLDSLLRQPADIRPS